MQNLITDSNALLSLLLQPNPNTKGAYIAALETVTIPKWLQKHRNTFQTRPTYFDDIKYFAHTNVMGNWVYENAVNNQRQREGVDDEDSPRWEAQPLPWGYRMILDGKSTPFIIHQPIGQPAAKIYFQARQLSVQDSYFFDQKTGQKIDNSVVEPYLGEKPKSNRQGIENTIQVRTYHIESIQAVIYSGIRYEVKR